MRQGELAEYDLVFEHCFLPLSAHKYCAGRNSISELAAGSRRRLLTGRAIRVPDSTLARRRHVTRRNIYALSRVVSWTISIVDTTFDGAAA
jgi:hypothetical protein